MVCEEGSDGAWGPQAGLRLRGERRVELAETARTAAHNTRPFNQDLSTLFPCNQVWGHSQACDYFFMVIMNICCELDQRNISLHWKASFRNISALQSPGYDNNIAWLLKDGEFAQDSALGLPLLHTPIPSSLCSMTFSSKQTHRASCVRPALGLTCHSLSGLSWKNQYNQWAEKEPQVNRSKRTGWGFSWSWSRFCGEKVCEASGLQEKRGNSFNCGKYLCRLLSCL